MRLIEWEVAEDGHEEQIIIPKEKREHKKLVKKISLRYKKNVDRVIVKTLTYGKTTMS
jgi:hypothetical protein